VGFGSQHPASAGLSSSTTIPHHDEGVPKAQSLLLRMGVCDNCSLQCAALHCSSSFLLKRDSIP